MTRRMVLMNQIIKEISMGPFGSDIKVDNYIDSGVPVLNGANISGIKLIENSFNYVTHEKAISLKKANAKRGDIVITHRGTLGQICYIPDNSKFENYVISQSQFRVTLKTDLVDPRYFVYYFHTSEGQKRLLANKSYVGVPALAQATSNFRLIDFPLPELKKQKKIADILSALDAKIELNNRINAELESLAKTIYDYWFVQFDFPFDFAQGKPSADGKPYKSSGGEMVYVQEGKGDRAIPAGWKVISINEIAMLSTDSINPMLFPDKNFKYYSIPVFDELKTYSLEKGANIRSNKFTVTGNDVVVSKLNPWFNRVIYPLSENDMICSTEFVIWCTSNRLLKNFLYSIATSQLFTSFCTQFASGTSNSHKRISPNNMMKYKIIFNQELAHLFGEKVDPIIKLRMQNQKQIQQLIQLRDWLLPLLMNGQVSIK